MAERGKIPSAEQVATDAFCVASMMRRHAPRGTLTVFGSARAREDQDSYRYTRRFAHLWTKRFGAAYPILTGGGLGLMEAANRGAFDAKGQSLSIGTAFVDGVVQPNPYSTHSYMAASFSQREADLVDYAAAIVVAPGGFGTEWEIFESLSKIQTQKKTPVPLVLLGGRKAWSSFFARIEDMKRQGTIAAADVDTVSTAESPEIAVEAIANALGLKK